MLLLARRLCSTPSSSSVRATVLRLADAAGSNSATNLHSDLSAKFELLTACEKEFGVPMPHAALNDVASLDDAVRYWETRVEEIAEEEAETQSEPPGKSPLTSSRMVSPKTETIEDYGYLTQPGYVAGSGGRRRGSGGAGR